jgi:hypothetical protein
MKSLGDFKDLNIPFRGGVLDGRYASGEATPLDYRVLLNVNTTDERGKGRLPGWTAWRSDDVTNEDLHDQLLGGSGYMDGDEFVAYDGQREAITILFEARSSNGTIYSIAGTKSRIYASTGQGRNWRIIADNLAGGYVEGESPWPNIKQKIAQVGDFILYTNGIDPVLAWPLGGAVITEGDFASRRWAAFEVYDLLGLDIDRAGVVASWNGFAFIGDVTEAGTRSPGRIYWSDAGAPLEWAPGGESLAGYVDLGSGETVLTIEPIGGQLRVYTDRAIYLVTLVGGEAVFQFLEIYRGDLALAFQNSFVNGGDFHLWMVQDSIVVLGAYDRVPNRYEWMHRAAGFIFNGMDGRYTADWPGNFDGFNPLDKTRCYQIAAGYDANLGNVWISWPTQRTSQETPDDPNDFEGVRRITLILNPRYQKATLVDHGFSAFALMRKHDWKTVRDFMIENGVCDAEDMLSDDALFGEKEGYPLNTLEAPENRPTCIWNETENPEEPMSPDSVAARVCGIRLAIDCKQCVPEPRFCMASVSDFSLKEYDISARLREVYTEQTEPEYVPENNNHFPNVVKPHYTETGYPTLIAGEVGQWGTRSEKIVTRATVDYDAEAQTVPGKLLVQLGVTNSPRCVTWHDSDSVTMDCLQEGADAEGARPAEPAAFPFYRVGAWIAYRVFVASGDEELNYSPTGCGVNFNTITILAKPKNATWQNQ